MSSTTVIVVVVVVVIVVLGLAALAWSTAGRRRSRRLQEQFGPEYEHQLAETHDPAETERTLAEREKRHRSLQLRDLEEGERASFERRWTDVQSEFVDDPDSAVEHADALVDALMSARGYPDVGADQRVADVSVDHPEEIQRYREARRIAEANRGRPADTEELRGAVTSYRELVTVLLGGPADAEADRTHRHEQPDTRETRA